MRDNEKAKKDNEREIEKLRRIAEKDKKLAEKLVAYQERARKILEKEADKMDKIKKKQDSEKEVELKRMQKSREQPSIFKFLKPLAAVLEETAVVDQKASFFETFFRPFNVKAGVEMYHTKIDPMLLDYTPDYNVSVDVAESEFIMFRNSTCIQKPQSIVPRVINYEGEVVYKGWKLLQFAEDIRPPYFGTFICDFRSIYQKV